MLNVIQCDVELVVMLVGSTTIFRPSISENTQHRKFMFLIKRQHTIIEHISGRNRCFSRVKLRVSDLGVGIHKGLLIDTTDALKGAHVIRVLRAKVNRVLRFDLTTGFIVVFLRSIAAT